MVEKKEGATMTCFACKSELVCHMSKYGDRQNNLQWQNSDGSAHYNYVGKDDEGKVQYKCNKPEEKPKVNSDESDSTEPIEDDDQYLQNRQKEIREMNDSLPKFDSMEEFVEQESILMLSIRKKVTDVVKKYEVDPHSGMIYEITKEIYRKWNYEKRNQK